MVLSLLWRYLSMYWLKPFDAVNDAANAWSLRQFPWEAPILEIGGGDGVFSFIMHGGAFAFADDRYDHADPARGGDIFDVYRSGQPLTVQRPAMLRYEVGVDLKWSHVAKARETRLYRALVIAAPAPLPFAAKSFNTVFLYFPHGLVERGSTLDYAHVLAEIRRVLVPGGSLLMTAVNREIARYFVFHPLHRFFERLGWRRPSAYFSLLDAGRYAEISGVARRRGEWEDLLGSSGFEIVEASSQVRPIAWRVYDLQTRPFLRPLMWAAGLLRKMGMKSPVKALWMMCWLPILVASWWTFARPNRARTGRGLFFTFRAVAI